MNEDGWFIYEAEKLASERLNEALILIQQAESELAVARQATGEESLKIRLNDYMGALSLVRDSGNVQLNKLRDLLDPS